MRSDYDIVFAGAGLAGLSLAARLAALPDPPRILLVDPRRDETRDRTWCHWQLHKTIFDDAITHRWHSWIVANGPSFARATSKAVPYVRTPSDCFRRIALEKIGACPRAEIVRGISVSSLQDETNGAVVQLCDGRRIASSWVLDGRPPRSDNAPWRQIFRGLELHAPEAELDAGTLTLMDFQSAGPRGIRFFYVLPLDAKTALVEDTWLVPAGEAPEFTDDKILSYATKYLGEFNWRIRHREEGDLPLGLPASAVREHQRIIPWGTAAGAVRASSGYAFSRIQAASERMANAWQRTGRPDLATAHGTRLIDWMDRVFLRAMTDRPERVPEYFVRMFGQVVPDSLVRFLESEPRALDILRVMRSLPPGPFVRAALR